MLSERARNLSQGQRQLLSIARTLLADPAILILDEATSSVDTRTEARIQRSLLGLMAGRTSFVIAHRLSTIRDADQVLVGIDGGRIVERGTHAELLARKGVVPPALREPVRGAGDINYLPCSARINSVTHRAAFPTTIGHFSVWPPSRFFSFLSSGFLLSKYLPKILYSISLQRMVPYSV